jgi:hypothetical protein
VKHVEKPTGDVHNLRELVLIDLVDDFDPLDFKEELREAEY